MGARRIALCPVTFQECPRTVRRALDGVVDPGCRDDLRVSCAAAAQGEQSDPSRVAQRRTDPAVRKGIAVAVDSDLRVVLGTHGLPEFPRHQLAEPGLARLLQNPGEHVGEDGAVLEGAAVRQSLTSVAKNSWASAGRGSSSGRHKYTRSLTAMSPSGRRNPPRSGARPHVEQLLYGRAGEGRAAQFGHDRLNLSRDVEHALAGGAPATRPVTDLDTDIKMCGVSGRSPLRYRSVTIRP